VPVSLKGEVIPIGAEVVFNPVIFNFFVVMIEEVHAELAFREWNSLVCEDAALRSNIVDKLVKYEFAISWVIENILTPEIRQHKCDGVVFLG
jgi:hypothetical protein